MQENSPVRVHRGWRGAQQRTNLGPALEAVQLHAAARAAADPVRLAKAARCVRYALAHGLITPAELGILATKNGKRP